MSRLQENPFENIVSVIAPIEQLQNAGIKKLTEQEDLKFSNKTDMMYHITHKINNIKHSNGRIYLKIDNDGKLFANSISPYAESFLDNIEEKIKPLVESFKSKRYLTYSSCEGHGLTFRRYIGLAFVDMESRKYVEESIKKLNLFGVFCKNLESVANQKLERDKKGFPIFVEKYDEKSILNDKKNEVDTFNIQFHRNYENYYFLELVIFEEINFSFKTPIKLLKQIVLAFMKKFYWDVTTNKILKCIESENFLKYKY